MFICQIITWAVIINVLNVFSDQAFALNFTCGSVGASLGDHAFVPDRNKSFLDKGWDEWVNYRHVLKGSA